ERVDRGTSGGDQDRDRQRGRLEHPPWILDVGQQRQVFPKPDRFAAHQETERGDGESEEAQQGTRRELRTARDPYPGADREQDVRPAEREGHAVVRSGNGESVTPGRME